MPDTAPSTILPDTILPDTITQIPLDQIDDAALPRDRTCLVGTAMAELKHSITFGGLRLPIEVFPLEAPRAPLRWGLLSGYRRYRAFRELNADQLAANVAAPRFAAIPALVRPREVLAAQLVSVVEENAIRADLSPWEQGHIAVEAWRQRIFDTLDAAVDTLYRAASRQKRSQLRAAALVVEEFDGILTDPEMLNQHQLTRLSRAVQAGFGEIMRAALETSKRTAAGAQWELVLPYILEAEAAPAPDAPPSRPDRPRRLSRIRKGLIIRRAMGHDGWVLHFSGAEATSTLVDEVIDDIEWRWGR